MGVLNVTPDSFSDGGAALDPDRALDLALAMEAAGADVIDIGAESTRPGAAPLTGREERARLLPVMRQLHRLRMPLSIDTTKAEVARFGLDEGAVIVNDISGLQYDPGARRHRRRARRAARADAHARPPVRHVRARRATTTSPPTSPAT